jgi:hypothetical protein
VVAASVTVSVRMAVAPIDAEMALVAEPRDNDGGRGSGMGTVPVGRALAAEFQGPAAVGVHRHPLGLRPIVRHLTTFDAFSSSVRRDRRAWTAVAFWLPIAR